MRFPPLRRSPVDLATSIGSVSLPNPIMTAAGTAGYGLELDDYIDLERLGAFVVKSLAPYPWAGNPPPRVHETPAGMINAVGLQGPGVEAWIEDTLPSLTARGIRVVASIWGRSVADYAAAAEQLRPAKDHLLAVEVNVSCPNVEARNAIFAHSANATTEVIAATEACGVPRWAKLSPNIGDIVPIAEAAQAGGAEAVTLINTVMGMALDIDARRPILGNGGGGMSGPAIRPIAVRAIYECHRALPNLPIVGVGGVASGEHAIELLMAGASAVQVGTATFAEPTAATRVVDEVAAWCSKRRISRVTELIGGAQQ